MNAFFGPSVFPTPTSSTALGASTFAPGGTSPFFGGAAAFAPYPFSDVRQTGGAVPGTTPGAMQGMTVPPVPSGSVIPTAGAGTLPAEESFVENILRMNLGKRATIYMTFENNDQWNSKVFTGILEAAGRDHIIISDPQTGKRYLLLMVNLDYIMFDEELNYTLPFGMSAGSR